MKIPTGDQKENYEQWLAEQGQSEHTKLTSDEENELKAKLEAEMKAPDSKPWDREYNHPIEKINKREPAQK